MPRFGRNDALVKKHPWLGRFIEIGVPDDKIELKGVDREVFSRKIERSDHRISAYLILFDAHGNWLGRTRGHRFFADEWDKTVAEAVDACLKGHEIAYMLYVDNCYYAKHYFSFYYGRNASVAKVLNEIREADAERENALLDKELTAA